MRLCAATKTEGKETQGEKREKTKQVNNRCDRMHWKMWKRAKREKCKWLCGRAADEWRWGGTTVFCSNQNDLLRGCGGGNMETSHFKYVSRLGDIHEWNSSLLSRNSTRDQNITHWLIFNLKKKALLAHLLQCCCQVPQGWRRETVPDGNALRRIYFFSMQWVTFLWGYCNFLAVSFLFFKLYVLELLQQSLSAAKK